MNDVLTLLMRTWDVLCSHVCSRKEMQACRFSVAKPVAPTSPHGGAGLRAGRQFGSVI